MAEKQYDWRGFQEVFYPHTGSGADEPRESIPLLAIMDQEQVVTCYSKRQDLSDLSGVSTDDFLNQTESQEVILLQASQIESWLKEAVAKPHYYSQMELLKEKAAEAFNASPPAYPKGRKRIRRRTRTQLLHKVSRKHFFIEALLGWWTKVLPVNYGIFIRIEGQSTRDFFFTLQNGEFKTFFTPDLSAVGEDRSRQPEPVVKYLSERFSIPVQGIFVSGADWKLWSESSDPWKEIVAAIWKKQARLHPFNTQLFTLMCSRAYLGL